jgi:CheY-like chemotaxis protein
MTRRVLAGHGYNVLVAANGAEAIALAAEYPGDIDLLLTDVVMPQMGGKQVAEQIRAARPKIRVLYMSGYAEPVMTSQGTLDEGVILIAKPFSQAALLEKVRELLDQV